MTTTANIVPTAGSDGIPYCTNVPLVSSEADLGDRLLTPDPVVVAWGQAIIAVVKLTINGIVTGSNAYVVLQTDMGDGTWVDVAWITTTFNQGQATFVLVGAGWAANNAFQQSRQASQSPGPTGSNIVPIAGRVRFVGKATAVGGSSSLAGTTAGISATIKYKLLDPR